MVPTVTRVTRDEVGQGREGTNGFFTIEFREGLNS